MFALLVSCLAVVAAGHRFRYSRTQNVNASTALTVVAPAIGGAQACSDNGALAKNFVASVSTDTPTRDEVVTTIFVFDLEYPINDGVAYYDVTLNGFPYSAQAPLCDETQKSGDPCPLATGHHHQVSIAENTITGKLTTKITWTTETGQEILCAQITLKSA